MNVLPYLERRCYSLLVLLLSMMERIFQVFVQTTSHLLLLAYGLYTEYDINKKYFFTLVFLVLLLWQYIYSYYVTWLTFD